LNDDFEYFKNEYMNMIKSAFLDILKNSSIRACKGKDDRARTDNA